MRVVLIGAGISSALISLLLRQRYGAEIELVVFDKDKHIGGRMMTSYETEENLSCSLDMGATYLAERKSNTITNKFFQQLINDQVIELFDREKLVGMPDSPLTTDYTAPRGIVSVVQYFFEKAAVEIHVSKHITKIDFNSSSDKFTIFTDEEQLDESEVVIVTIPVPQILGHLKGSIAQLIDNNKEVKDKLAQVKYNSRFAIGLFYPPSVTTLNIPWSIYCVDDSEHDFLRYLVVDNVKRNKDEPPFSLLAHTSMEFGAEHIEEDEKIVGKQIKEALFQFLPNLPGEISNVKYHKFKYCQVLEPYSNEPGYLILNEHPLLVLAGDSFATESNIQSCIEAAVKTVKRIQTMFA